MKETVPGIQFPRGRRTSARDQNSKTTTYAYDSADRKTFGVRLESGGNPK